MFKLDVTDAKVVKVDCTQLKRWERKRSYKNLLAAKAFGMGVG